LTPDQRKAYVSNEQPPSQGTISVIDLIDHKVVGTIRNVNCPEGSVVSPDGTRLYDASQCGAGQDPLFIIDTATDTVVDKVRVLAVGLTVAITPDGTKLYVARGGFRRLEPLTDVPNQLSIITTRDNKVVKTLSVSATALAFTADGRHLVAVAD